ncbi:hypothetical protein RFI_08802 [Reticulomyxa filosa]|uniref:Ubiquitin-like domain-containing protein n=1 Tax=Reticulomyxa filosa TaxID=46433 RepID=X6NQP7_RETFI|nr:hypothetical protein RFI_08802 [Reticulomyxa filosa]|eukprot:ETO28331.1 hypothetical protein RFI_08802 [Reticulomyxa filosa]
MFISVKSLNGNKNEINVDDDATVKQVKLILQEKEGIPSDQLRIIFKGKLLNDTDKLKDKEQNEFVFWNQLIEVFGVDVSFALFFFEVWVHHNKYESI